MSQAICEDAVILPSAFFPFLSVCENPSSGEAARAANFTVAVAEHTLKVLFSDPAIAAELRELLPETLDAVYRENMREHGVADSVLYRFKHGSVPSRENLERIADALERQDLVSELEIPAHEFRDHVLKTVDDFHRRGEHEAAQLALAWCDRVAMAAFTGRPVPDCELSDLPDGIRELAFAFRRGRIAMAKKEARARRVTPAAIRKRRSRVHGAARRNPVSGDDLLL
jgi:hypothetical protein